MNNKNNAIATVSDLYKDLIEAFEIKDKKERFEVCYKLANRASYKDIHMAITYVKEDDNSGDLSNIPDTEIVSILKSFLILFTGNLSGRRAYLLDILEEARERKRKYKCVGRRERY